ncbi:hypothetical protein [Pseudaquabacterium terrae]|nr:hypothetical protein [Aquabacterium terrae]
MKRSLQLSPQVHGMAGGACMRLRIAMITIVHATTPGRALHLS